MWQVPCQLTVESCRAKGLSVVQAEDVNNCGCVKCQFATTLLVQTKDSATDVATLTNSLQTTIGAGFTVTVTPSTEAGKFTVKVQSEVSGAALADGLTTSTDTPNAASIRNAAANSNLVASAQAEPDTIDADNSAFTLALSAALAVVALVAAF